MPDFSLVLRAYGHTTIRAREHGLESLPDDELVAAAKQFNCDFLLTLDNNRQPEVWSRLLARVAAGDGRLLRIKIPSTKIPSVPNLTLPWAIAYAGIEPMLTDKAVRMIQVGLSLNSQRAIKGGYLSFRNADIAALVQQEMRLHQGSLRAPGSPRLNPAERIGAGGRTYLESDAQQHALMPIGCLRLLEELEAAPPFSSPRAPPARRHPVLPLAAPKSNRPAVHQSGPSPG